MKLNKFACLDPEFDLAGVLFTDAISFLRGVTTLYSLGLESMKSSKSSWLAIASFSYTLRFAAIISLWCCEL
jgi:hypothetical protein